MIAVFHQDSMITPIADVPARAGEACCGDEMKKRRAGDCKAKKWRLLLPGASEPRLTGLNPSGLEIGLSNCVTQPEQPEHSCRLQLLKSPITAEQYREKASPLRPRRSCFAPAETRHHGKSGFGGGAGCCPRVRMVYCGGHLFP